MKLRIKGDSLRLRLTRAEVATLASDGVLSERMQLPGASPNHNADNSAQRAIIGGQPCP